MRRMYSMLVALWYAVFLSCVSAYPPSASGEAGAEKVLRVWVAAESSPSGAFTWSGAVMEGCGYWAPKGVRCVQVSNKSLADVRVSFGHGPCMTESDERDAAKRNGHAYAAPLPLKPECRGRPLPKGRHIVGLEDGKGNITLSVTCMHRVWGATLDPRKVAFLAAHEIGHALGIRDHVPAACDDPCIEYRRSPNGTPLCGPAVMNDDGGEPDSFAPTDSAAFDLRKPGFALSP